MLANYWKIQCSQILLDLFSNRSC